MGEMVVFSVLLILGLFLLFNGKMSLNKLQQNNRQWENIFLVYERYKNSNDILLDMAVEDIKNMDNFSDKTAKLNTMKDGIYTKKKYQDNYPQAEKIVKKLKKIITFFASIEIFLGIFGCLFSFVFIYNLFSLNTGWLGEISILILFCVFGMIFYSLLGKQFWDIGALLGFNLRYKLLIDYFQNGDYQKTKNIEQVFNHYLTQYRFLKILLNNTERDYELSIDTRIIILALLYIGLFILVGVIAVNPLFIQAA